MSHGSGEVPFQLLLRNNGELNRHRFSHRLQLFPHFHCVKSLPDVIGAAPSSRSFSESAVSKKKRLFQLSGPRNCTPIHHNVYRRYKLTFAV
ncbi:hypothetical protein AGIG_G14591 [Arapaima gigas]